MADRLIDWIDEALLRRLAARVLAAHPRFDVESFVAAAQDRWPDTLVLRLDHITDALAAHLPEEWWPVVEDMVQQLPSDSASELGFEVWPLIELVGGGTSRPGRSLALLGELGAKTYAELGVRPYLSADLSGTLLVLQQWTHDPRAGVRRLASEASRPRLPWASALRPLVEDPRPTLPILTELCDDEDHLVRNSVANHLNDISKDHPDVVLEVLGRWLAQPTERRRWIAERALRTLTRRGDERALALLGRGPVDVEVQAFAVDEPRPAIGGAVEMTAAIRSREATDREVAVEVAIHFLRASGRTRRVVFKWWRGELAPGQTWSGRRRQSFAELSTRTHHPGEQRMSLLVNGQAVAELVVDLQAAGS